MPAFLWLLVGAIGLLWGGWPLLMRTAGESNKITTLLLSVFAALVLGLMAIGAKSPMPSLSTTWRVAIAGTMMALGLVAFNYLTTHPKVELSTVIPIINCSMLLVTVLGGIWFFSEAMTFKKLMGIALILIGIVLLRPNS